MISSSFVAFGLQDEVVAYDPSRLYATLAFMFVVVIAAIAFVRWRFPKRLIADIASTLVVTMCNTATSPNSSRLMTSLFMSGILPVQTQGHDGSLLR